jgi:hypothetical protein
LLCDVKPDGTSLMVEYRALAAAALACLTWKAEFLDVMGSLWGDGF